MCVLFESRPWLLTNISLHICIGNEVCQYHWVKARACGNIYSILLQYEFVYLTLWCLLCSFELTMDMRRFSLLVIEYEESFEVIIVFIYVGFSTCLCCAWLNLFFGLCHCSNSSLLSYLHSLTYVVNVFYFFHCVMI